MVLDTHPIVCLRSIDKTNASGFRALKNINLGIKRGEIFALIGPNGGRNTTLISIVCGNTNATSGTVVITNTHVERAPSPAVHEFSKLFVRRSVLSVAIAFMPTIIYLRPM
jgi:ABC-type multidrug transport system ATPase subunit